MSATSATPATFIRGNDPPAGILTEMREVIARRELVVNLGLREIRVRYKQSILGIGWALIQPLTTVFVFTVIFSRFAKLPSEGVPYPVFSYTALLPWMFFSSSVSAAAGSVAGGISLIKKVYFPRAVLPVASILAHTVDFLISAVVFALLLAYYRIEITVNVLYILPLLIIQLLLMVGISLFLSAVNAYYRDVRYVLPMLMQVWLYATPVVWSMTTVPDRYRTWYALVNPMAVVIDGFRAAIVRATAPDWPMLVASSLTTAMVFVLGARYFTYVQRNFADII